MPKPDGWFRHGQLIKRRLVEALEEFLPPGRVARCADYAFEAIESELHDAFHSKASLDCCVRCGTAIGDAEYLAEADGPRHFACPIETKSRAKS